MICLVIAQNKYDDHNEFEFYDINGSIKKEFVFNSTEKQGIFYCSSRIDLNEQNNNLMASINYSVLTSPAFELKTEQVNSTTIRIRIIPNDYIGINRIICHWNNNITYGKPINLTIGEKPGLIQLSQSCQIYDHHYVQCIFHAPVIGRAFRNGFPKVYQFSELTSQKEYFHPPKLINITDENELIFNFVPRDKNRIPTKISMDVNITLKHFGSTYYKFNLEAIHIAKTDFRIAHISSNHLTMVINYNSTGTVSERLCAGHVYLVDNPKASMIVKDIMETSAQTILINRLHSSTKYKICLYCFYERIDQSFQKEICHIIKTKRTSTFILWIVGVSIAGGFIILILIIYTICKNRSRTKNIPSINNLGPEEESFLTSPSDSLWVQTSDNINDPAYEPKYQPVEDSMEQIIDKITPRS
ncbi:unnamed protein product [Rotaria sordida]|uniref:Uncharacterized protein n=1 Tax=Rotaria sordida TaxID=392033 RepID=A0A815IS43_9BILA|nr:unnamed protein product [Rotaria sordida]